MLIHWYFCGLYHIGNDLGFLCGAAFQHGSDLVKGGAGGGGGGSVQQIISADFQSGGDIHEHGQAQFGVACFDVAHVGGGDVDLLRQFLLWQSVCLADFAYLLADLVVIHQITAYVVKIYLNYIGDFDRIT